MQEALEQHLETLKAGEDPDDWIWDLVEWLLQEILDLEFNQFLGVAPYERSQEWMYWRRINRR